MTDPKIRVSADVSAVESELSKIQAAAQKVNQTLSSGEVGIDAKQAKADLAALEKSAATLVDRLNKAKESGDDLSGIDFDAVTEALDGASKAADQLDQVLSAVGQSSGMAQTVRNAKQTADHFQRAVRAQELLGRDGVRISRQQADSAKRQFDNWRQSGARGTSRIRNQEFDDWIAGGWRSYSMDEGEARRHRDRVLESVGVQSGSGGESGSGGNGSRRAKMFNRMGAAAGALGGMAGSALQGGGDGLFGSIGAGGGTLLGMGAGAVVGGPAGAVVGAAVGAFASKLLGGLGNAVDQGIQRAASEGADVTDLRQSVGATKIDFDHLRDSIRYFSDGLGLTYQESAKLARSFAHTAGQMDPANIGREVGSASGFARGYGMAPDAAVQFFATMRHFGVSSDDQGNRKLALQIGEAVARGGTSTKMDEVLASIQGYVQSASRASVTQANAESYASFMSSLTGLSMFGMKGDVQAAASAMGQADSSLRQGGAFGEASKNFSLGLYQRMLPGFSALDQDFVNEQGAFGTIGNAFGRDSAAYKFAESRGDSGKMAQYDDWVKQGGSQSILSMQMQALEKQFGGNTDEFRKAIQSQLGVGAGQASALYQAYLNDKGLGGLETSLRNAGVQDMSKLNTKQIATLAELSTGDSTVLKKQAGVLAGLKGGDALSKGQREDLEKAVNGNDTEALRRMVIGLSATRNTSSDQGDLMRRQQADMANAMQKLATELIPLTTDIKQGIIELVKKAAPDSKFVKDMEARAVQQRKDEETSLTTVNAYDENIRKLKSELSKTEDPEKKKDLQEAISLLETQRNAAVSRAKSLVGPESSGKFNDWAGNLSTTDGSGYTAPPANAPTGVKAVPPRKGMQLSKEELAYLSETDKLIGARPGTSAAQIQVESGNDDQAISNRGAWGLSQLMPKTKAALERRLGRPIVTREDQLLAHRMLMQENLGKFGNVEDSLRAYNGGWDRQGWSNNETMSYVPKIEATRRESAARKYGMSLGGDGKVEQPEAGSGPELDRKAPAGVAPGIQSGAAGQRQDIRIDNRVTLYDQNGNERGDSSVQTRVGAPTPQGMVA